MASFLLPSLRASTSSSASSSSSSAFRCCPSLLVHQPRQHHQHQRRTVVHHPRLPNPPKYKAKLHPASFTAVLPAADPFALDGGAEFIYSPAPSAPVIAGATTLPAELSPSGKRLPPSWRRDPGYGYMAPRVDRLQDGSPAAQALGRQTIVSPEIQHELKRLRTEDPVQWTSGKLAKKFGLTAHLVAKYAPAPAAYAAQARLDSSLRLERQPMHKLVALEARELRKAGW